MFTRMALVRNLRFAWLLVVASVGSLNTVGCGKDGASGGQNLDAAASRPDTGSKPDAIVDAAVDKVPISDAAPVVASDVSQPEAPPFNQDAVAAPDMKPPGAMDAMNPAPIPDAAAPPDAPAPVDSAPPVTDVGSNLPQPSAMSIAVYDEATVVDLYLTFPAGEWDRLLTLMGPNEGRWVSCTVAGFGTPATPASCRRKGDPLDWLIEKKPQIVVRFNRTDSSGRFRGLRRLNLESFDGTSAPIRDRIGMWLMREAGVNAPRANNARVFKDGAYLGLYQNIEALDKEFLEDHFGADANGNLWEDGFDLKTNEDMPNQSRLDELNALVERESLNGDHTAFFAALATRIDVPQFLLEMAAETALLAQDNFSNGSSNFSYYEHPKRGFMVLPWDFDSIFTEAPVTADLYDYRGVSDEPNKMRRLMNQNPLWKKQFDDALVQIRDQHLSRVPAKVDQVCALIREAVRTDPNRTATFADFETDCTLVKTRVTQRIAAIKQVLGR
jgi:hypothetical protein